MKKAFIFLIALGCVSAFAAQRVPAPLKPWIDWTLWDHPDATCPTTFNAANQRLCVWPGTLTLNAGKSAGQFTQTVRMFNENWLDLPGDSTLWPATLTVNNRAVPVVTRNGVPAIKLAAGTHTISGQFNWDTLPQKIRIPEWIGIIRLTVNGKSIDAPSRDGNALWLQRRQEETATRDMLGVKVYRLLTDGIPMWVTTQVELRVSGKSREETIGTVGLDGWQLGRLVSPIPVAVEPDGTLRAQVRPGKWTVTLTYFRTHDEETLQLPANATLPAPFEYIAYHANPVFRTLDLDGATPVDASQTTVPDAWKQYPVYQWNPEQPVKLVTRMQGSTITAPQRLSLNRELWLRQNGTGYTYKDDMNGHLEQIWRLDAAEGQELGRVEVDAEGQLITRNPANDAVGIEIRKRELTLQAIGTIEGRSTIPAVGWASDVDYLSASINLPPGWRLFACFGADKVHGDWLTAWTLLDLFLLLIFSLAVYRLFGLKAGIIIFIGFAMSYHEPGAPRYSWLFLLMPMALLRYVPEGKLRSLVKWWRNLAVLILVLIMIPFFHGQIQGILYPQLEQGSWSTMVGRVARRMAVKSAPAPMMAAEEMALAEADESRGKMARQMESFQNVAQQQQLSFSPDAKIQTGPGVPEWSWRSVRLEWNGPVAATQQVRPVLIPPLLHRLMAIIGLALLIWMVMTILDIRSDTLKPRRWTVPVLLLFLLTGMPAMAQQYPDQELLDTLRKRMLEPADCYPHCAEIQHADLTIRDDRLTCDLTVHAMETVGMPLPGKLPGWSPVNVELNGRSTITLKRNGYLWVLVPSGTHTVSLTGRIPSGSDWQWDYQLKPHHVAVRAPGWQVTGIGKHGVPENQLFFSRKQPVKAGTNDMDRYDRVATDPLVVVHRTLELGLNWQVRSRVVRLSEPGRAIALTLPLLDGERVLTATDNVKDGKLEIRLGSNQNSYNWESELPITSHIKLTASETMEWVEQWHLVMSPVWHVDVDGMEPGYEQESDDVHPVWKPWPGQQVTLAVHRPEAVEGPTVTVSQVKLEGKIGSRLAETSLSLTLNSSIGQEFQLKLPADVQVERITKAETNYPIQQQDDTLNLPLEPGQQVFKIDLKHMKEIGFWTGSEAITLPVPSSNITTTLNVPVNRWVLWASGPDMGPAVRFWSLLILVILLGLILGNIPQSPLSRIEWILLGIGLTQVPLVSAIFVTAWLFLLAFRGSDTCRTMAPFRFNMVQLVLIFITFSVLVIFIQVVHAGLMGSPVMHVVGNGSNGYSLNWYRDLADGALPSCGYISVSIWFYRLLMLAWSLWLAHSLIRWLTWSWKQFSLDGYWKNIDFPWEKKPETDKSVPGNTPTS